MRIEESLKLDFKDVLFRPKRSTLGSRSQATVTRQLQFVHSGQQFNGVPIIAANMDTVGTFSMARALEQHHMLVALHKHYDTQQYIDFYNGLRPGGYNAGTIGFKEFNKLTHFFSMGILERDFEKFQAVAAGTELNFPVCIDVANGYTETMVDFIKRFRDLNPNRTIMAGNVVTAEMTEQLILSGADIVKVGIGPGCFAPGSIVHTLVGSKPIEGVVIGDKVKTHLGNWKSVTNKFKFTDKKKIVKVNNINATPNHEFYVVHKKHRALITDDNIHEYAEWIPAGDLTKDYLLIKHK